MTGKNVRYELLKEFKVRNPNIPYKEYRSLTIDDLSKKLNINVVNKKEKEVKVKEVKKQEVKKQDGRKVNIRNEGIRYLVSKGYSYNIIRKFNKSEIVGLTKSEKVKEKEQEKREEYEHENYEKDVEEIIKTTYKQFERLDRESRLNIKKTQKGVIIGVDLLNKVRFSNTIINLKDNISKYNQVIWDIEELDPVIYKSVGKQVYDYLNNLINKSMILANELNNSSVLNITLNIGNQYYVLNRKTIGNIKDWILKTIGIFSPEQRDGREESKYEGGKKSEANREKQTIQTISDSFGDDNIGSSRTNINRDSGFYDKYNKSKIDLEKYQIYSNIEGENIKVNCIYYSTMEQFKKYNIQLTKENIYYIHRLTSKVSVNCNVLKTTKVLKDIGKKFNITIKVTHENDIQTGRTVIQNIRNIYESKNYGLDNDIIFKYGVINNHMFVNEELPISECIIKRLDQFIKFIKEKYNSDDYNLYLDKYNSYKNGKFYKRDDRKGEITTFKLIYYINKSELMEDMSIKDKEKIKQTYSNYNIEMMEEELILKEEIINNTVEQFTITDLIEVVGIDSLKIKEVKIVYADYECRTEKEKNISLLKTKILSEDKKEIKYMLESKGVDFIKEIEKEEEIKEIKEKYNKYVDDIYDDSEIQDKIIIDIHKTIKYKERAKKNIVRGKEYKPYSLAWLTNNNSINDEIDEEYFKNKRVDYIEDIKGDRKTFGEMLEKLIKDNPKNNEFIIYFHNLKYDGSFFKTEDDIIMINNIETEGKLFCREYMKMIFKNDDKYIYNTDMKFKDFIKVNLNYKGITIDGEYYKKINFMTKKQLKTYVESGKNSYLYNIYKGRYNKLERDWDKSNERIENIEKYLKYSNETKIFKTIDSFKIYPSSLKNFAKDVLGEVSKDVFPYDFLTDYFELYKVDFKEYDEYLWETLEIELEKQEKGNYKIFKENIKKYKLNNMSEYNKFYNISDVEILFKSMEKFQENLKNMFGKCDKHVSIYEDKEEEIREWVKEIKNKDYKSEGYKYFIKAYKEYVESVKEGENRNTILYMENEKYYYDNISKLTEENIRYYIIEGMGEKEVDKKEKLRMFIKQYRLDKNNYEELEKIVEENEEEKEIYEYWIYSDKLNMVMREEEEKEILEKDINELINNYKKYELLKIFNENYNNKIEGIKNMVFKKHNDMTISSIAYNTLSQLLGEVPKYGVETLKFLKCFIVGGRCDFLKTGEIKIKVKSEKHMKKMKKINKICEKLDINKPDINDNKLSDEDLNSLYPDGMVKMKCYKDTFKPINKNKFKIYEDKEIIEFFNNNYYLLKIEILDSNKKKEYPIGVYNKIDKGIVNWVNDMDNEIYYVDSERLKQLYKMNKIKKFKLIYGLEIENKKGINYNFSVGLNYIYNKRLEYKNKKNSIEKVYKLIMNSIYGKFIQKMYETTEIIVPNESTSIDNELRKSNDIIKSVRQLNNGNISIEKYKNDEKERYYQLGIQLLSITKNVMDELQYVVYDIFKTVIYYTDTDSFHLPNYVIKLVKEYYSKYLNKLYASEFLGSFTSDFSNSCYSTGLIVCGKKRYIHKLNDNKYHFISKGFSKNILSFLKNNMKNNIWCDLETYKKFIDKYQNLYDLYLGIYEEDELLKNKVDISKLCLCIRYDTHGNCYKIVKGIKGSLV